MSAESYEAPADNMAFDSGGGIYTNESVPAAEYEDIETTEAEEGIDAPEMPESAVPDRKLTAGCGAGRIHRGDVQLQQKQRVRLGIPGNKVFSICQYNGTDTAGEAGGFS